MTKISEPPHHGFGLHDWILETTRVLTGEGMGKAEVHRLVRERTIGKGREVSDYEINTAIEGAINWYQEHPGVRRGKGRKRKLVPFDQWLAEKKSRGGQRLGYRRSPAPKEWKAELDERLIAKTLRIKIPTLIALAEFPIWALYANLNYRICLAREARYPEIRTLEEWREREWRDYQLISPNPFLRCGVGVGTKVDANAGARMWVIIEFDHGDREEQLRKLFWLDQIRDLALIVYSGRKSLHGWFPVVGVSERLCCQFFRLATSIGADKGMQSSIQYTRLPWGLNRKTGVRQEIVHWDRNVIWKTTEKIRETAL